MFQRIFLTFLCQRFYIAKVWKNLTLASYKHLIVNTYGNATQQKMPIHRVINVNKSTSPAF